ncbi:MAG: efflux RND transporter periplasmic adaptor subunit [Steroidobacteraceae bacterium]
MGIYTARAEPATVITDLPGRTVAYRSAQVRPQVSGIIQKRLYVEGANVAAGEALYQIDPAPYQATLDSANAAVSKADANLYSAQLKYQRYLKLAESGAVSQQDKDDVTATLKQAEADLATARATQTTAKLNLDYTRVRAPIAGRIGTSAYTEGALVTANQDTALTTIQQYDPIYLDITQSAADAFELRSQLQSGALRRNANAKLSVQVQLADGTLHPQNGTLEYSGVSVSEDTGALTLRAVIPNSGGRLLPGLFVHALINQGTDVQALMVPQQSVTRDANGAASVLLVTADGKVQQRALVTGRAVGDRWLVSSGLTAGDRVIVQGTQRVKVGDTVKAVEVAQTPTPNAPAAQSSVAAP